MKWLPIWKTRKIERTIKVACCNCKHSRPDDFGSLFWLCVCLEAPRDNYVTGIRSCSRVNKDGNCPYYDQKEEVM